MTPQDFLAWRHRRNWSRAVAANALGISEGSVKLYEAGRRFDDGRAVEIPLTVQLACAALDQKVLSPISVKDADPTSKAKPNPTSVQGIAHRLKATREALGLTQSEFCDLAGVARNTYNQWEKGVSRPELDKAMLLCEAHGLTLDWIYRGAVSHLPYALASKITPALL